MLSDSDRVHEVDRKFLQDVTNEKFVNTLFVRLVAKKVRFIGIDFRYSIFDTCYLRNCIFDSCDFTGCRFIGTNIYGSKFSGCKFEYSSFEKTIIDSDILDTECPSPENLKMKFARTLRVNYQQIGDAISANKAIEVELKATEVHLKKSWNSNESYYRNKYKEWKRLEIFFEWVKFKILDYIWGNGESVLKLIRSTIIILIAVSLLDVVYFGDSNLISEYIRSFLKSPQIFLGIVEPVNYPKWYLATIFLVRLIILGFFMSIIIKRFNRR